MPGITHRRHWNTPIGDTGRSDARHLHQWRLHSVTTNGVFLPKTGLKTWLFPQTDNCFGERRCILIKDRKQGDHVFHPMEQVIPPYGIKCSMPWNKVFHPMEQTGRCRFLESKAAPSRAGGAVSATLYFLMLFCFHSLICAPLSLHLLLQAILLERCHVGQAFGGRQCCCQHVLW